MVLTKRLWVILFLVFTLSFIGLGLLGKEIYQVAPPIPEQVIVAETGEVLFTKEMISKGQNVWQSTGGHQNGTIWGHGSYLAPDWSADWLHREATLQLELYANYNFKMAFKDIPSEKQAMIKDVVKRNMRTNTYNPDTGNITVNMPRSMAIKGMTNYYDKLYSDNKELEQTRIDYAIKNNPVPDAENRKALAAFYFWTAWAAGTERPNDTITYTSNWPAEELVGNKPTASMLIWTMISVLVLLGCSGLLAWFYAVKIRAEEEHKVPEKNPLAKIKITPSMRATFKYFAVVVALFVVQIILGAVTAHFAVEGHDFYGIPIADYLPYAVTRTWHIQIAVFWIATAWLATGLFIGPAVSGKEPKFQVWGVNFLFISLLIIVVGSLFGEWAGVQQWFSLTMNFWFGHQGYEYIDLGRFWQIYLFIGLLLWVVLVTRAVWPALKSDPQQRQVLIILLLSTLCIGLFYGAGLMWGQEVHMSVMEYWRWWVVHLWVEGFFEVFATTIIAYLFAKMGLIRMSTAAYSVVFATIIFMFGGIMGTSHHWYFSGTPIGTIAYGATFSALEVVPLVLIGFEAYENYLHTKARPWVAAYKWPIMFFIAVSFWNLVGAGLLGFLINPPLVLYYTQGLNTTATHAHAALFGVYGMLGIGLMLFCLRSLCNPKAWSDKLLQWGFWSLNIGLTMMLLMSLLPLGLLQVITSVNEGMWYARTAEFMHQDIIHTLVWMRVPGDILFGIGGLFIAVFVAKLWLGRNLK